MQFKIFVTLTAVAVAIVLIYATVITHNLQKDRDPRELISTEYGKEHVDVDESYDPLDGKGEIGTSTGEDIPDVDN